MKFLTLLTNRISSRRQRTLLGGGILLLAVLSITLLATVLLLKETLAAEPNHAGVVVVYGNDKASKKCVDFSEDQISGMDALERTGLDISVDASNAMGVAVCKIGRNGCNFPGETCFCQCQGASCLYWSYWKWKGDKWEYSDLGASNTMLHDGDIDGWVWGVGTTEGAEPPPPVMMAEVCPLVAAQAATGTTVANTGTLTATPTGASATPTETLTPTSTSTRRVAASRTPRPTRTIGPPTQTRLPTATRGLTPRVTATRRIIAPAQPVQRRPSPTRFRINIPTVTANEPPPEPPPAPEEGQPTSTRVPRTPTRVALGNSGSTNGTQPPSSSVRNDSISGVDTHLLSGVVLGGGVLIGGCGFVLLLGGAGWYFFRRRTWW